MTPFHSFNDESPSLPPKNQSKFQTQLNSSPSPSSGCPFGFEVIGLNLSLAKTFSSETRQELIWAIQNYLLLFRNQSLTPLQQIEFTRLFGEIDYLGPPQNNQLGHPLLSSYVMRVANDKTQGYTRVGRYWYSIAFT